MSPTRGPVSRLFAWISAATLFLVKTLFVGWAALAIYYSDLSPKALRVVLAGWALWRPRRQMLVALGVLYLAIIGWWSSIKPSHDRDWRREVAVMPRAMIHGDTVRITGVRNFTYRSRDEFTAQYEERQIRLSDVSGLDFFVSYWSEGLVAHTFLSFNFRNGPPLSVSIETRPEAREGFDPVASLFKQFELIYVVGEERDIVGVRTNQRGEQVYMYRLNTSPEDARRLLLIYLTRINQLADKPEFYHLLSNSCTINIIRYANAAGRTGKADIRHLLNGRVDRYLYDSGRLATTLPFNELRRRSRINSAAEQAEGLENFSERIRASLQKAVYADGAASTR